VLRSALIDANVNARDVSFIEAHGTGTNLGDPIEIASMTAIYGSRCGRPLNEPLFVVGAKANMGHLEAAAGMTGLFSSVLSLQRKCVPPNAQLKFLNDKIAVTIEEEPIYFPEVVTYMNNHTSKLLGGLSSFGYSGTIAHLILERSARVTHQEKSNTKTSMAQVVWQYAGQGTLSASVFQEIYDVDMNYRNAIGKCDEITRSRIGFSLTDLLYSAEAQSITGLDDNVLKSTKYAQPALVAIEYSLSQSWIGRGMEPTMVIGHSLGEYAAAVVAGVMTIEDALGLVCERGRLMHESDECRGSMVAIRASVDTVSSFLDFSSTQLSVAAV